jgi:hypothetical protein
MANTNDLTVTALTLGALSSMSSAFSSVLAPFYNPMLPENEQVDFLDLSLANIAPLSSNAALAGLPAFTNLKTLNLNNSPIPEWACDISSLKLLEKLVLYHTVVPSKKSQVIGDLSKMPNLKYIDLGTPYGWTGDLSGRTNIEYFFASLSYDTDITINPKRVITIPVIGNNKNLTFCLMQYVKNTQTLTPANIGVINNLMKLTTLNLTGCTAVASTINYILAQLLVLKQTTGNALTTVVLSSGGMAAPTGQGITDKASLISLGVSVTTT